MPLHTNCSSAGIKERYVDFGINTPNMSMQNHSVPELPINISKHLSYTTTFKLQVVDFAETNGNRSVARRFGVDVSRLCSLT